MLLLVIALAACAASLLTFFSGFGLGTLLTPVMAIFFPVDIAIALTGVVHLLNNVFKVMLTGRYIHGGVVLRFGIPSMIAAFAGAWLLLKLGNSHTLYTYRIGQHACEITAVKLVMAGLMVFFTLMESLPYLKNLRADDSKLVIGGFLSGFFGGLSGHQGALRSIFLSRSGLSKESFIATGIAIACLVDLTRIPVYFSSLKGEITGDGYTVTGVAAGAAFIGAFAGSKLLKKVTLELVQKVVAVMIFLLAIALGSGVI